MGGAASSVDVCCATCLSNPECGGFVVAAGTCYLKGGSMSTLTKSGVTAYFKLSSSSSVVGGDDHVNTPGVTTTIVDLGLLPAAVFILALSFAGLSLYICFASPFRPRESNCKPSASKQVTAQLESDSLYPQGLGKRESFTQGASRALNRALSKNRDWKNLDPVEPMRHDEAELSSTRNGNIA